MRLVLAVAVCWCSLAVSPASGEKTFPYKAYVSADDVYVRSGPGRNYYPTSKLRTGDRVEVRSRRGAIRLAVKLTTREMSGAVFVPFHFREAAANLLTIDELDPDGKIPEFKFCSVAVTKLGD